MAASLTELKRNEEAQVWNERVRRTVRFANFGTYNLGCIACGEGDLGLAFAYLNYSTQIGFTDKKHLQKDGLLTKLHSDARFQKLLARMDKLRPIN